MIVEILMVCGTAGIAYQLGVREGCRRERKCLKKFYIAFQYGMGRERFVKLMEEKLYGTRLYQRG